MNRGGYLLVMRFHSHKTKENFIKSLFKAIKLQIGSFSSVHKFTLLTCVVTLLISASALVYAQSTAGQRYTIQTVHVFPDTVKTEGWRNVDTVRDQNVEAFSLYQDFNKINSAYIDSTQHIGYQRRYQDKDEVVLESSSDVTEDSKLTTPDVPSEEVEGVVDVGQENSEATTATGTEATIEELEQPVEMVDTVVEESDEEPIVETEGKEEVDEMEVLEVPAVTPENSSSTTISKRVTSFFEFALASAIDLLPFTESASTTGDEVVLPVVDDEVVLDIERTSRATNTPAQQVMAATTTATVTPEVTTEDVLPATTTTAEPDLTELATSTVSTSSDEVELDIATTTPVSETNGQAGQESTESESVSVPLCEEKCAPYTMTLEGFGLPIFNEELELGNVQLRVSFAAKEKITRDVIQELKVQYSLDDGATYDEGSSILIDGEASNSINGGYFLFALPTITDPAVLDDLVIQLRYEHDPRALENIFIESVWLELFTLEATNLSDIDIDSVLADTGFSDRVLSGDQLVLPDGTVINFTFTDENEDETLIIKSDKIDYSGLTKTVTYFNVTNESDNEDEFSLKTYFPTGAGEVLSLEEWNINKPIEVVVPEYRSYVYHCEAGWEQTDNPTGQDIFDISRQITPAFVPVGDPVVETEFEVELTNVIEEIFEASTSESVLEEITIPDEIEPESVSSEVLDTESALETPAATAVPEEDLFATTTAFRSAGQTLLPFAQAMSALNIPAIGTSSIRATTSLSTASSSLTSTEDAAQMYSCRDTNIIRTCDSLDGDNTSCVVDNVKVREHEMTKYLPNWEPEPIATGTPPDTRGLIKKTFDFFGFGPDIKPVPDHFEVSNHTPNTYKIAPGETKYFKMEISFPPFTQGEFWIEAIGDSEYGLLDPFWSSLWRYRKPIEIDNLSGATSTEQQVFLEITSAESDFWSNVNSDGSDIRFIQEVPGNTDDWYDVNWDNRLPITIQASEVDATLSNFPVYVNLADLGADFFANVQSDGDDIRITTADGQSELSREIVSIDTGAETGELHFKADSISSSVDTTFYIYYGNAAAPGYVADDPFGSESVWTNGFILNYHLEEDASGNGNAGLYQDATSNDYDGDDEITATGKSGKLGRGQEILARDTNPDDYILVPSDALNGENELSFSFWFNTSQNGDQSIINAGANNELILFLRNTQITLFDGGATDIFTFDKDVTGTGWKHMVVVRDANSSEWRLYVDGVEDNQSPLTEAMTALSVPADCIMIGGEQDTSCLSVGDNQQNYEGFLDEFRVHDNVLSADWISASFRNQSTSTDFYATSTSEVVIPTTFNELDHWVQHFDNTADEADIWVQVNEVPGNATSTIYLYYGNDSAISESDEYEPFTYSTTTDLYYVVNDTQTNDIVVYSLIDNNEVSIDGGAPVTLQSGETTSFTSAQYASTSVISALGPITARSIDNSSEPPVPISFATTTHISSTNRGSEDLYIHAPFTAAAVDVFAGAAVTPTVSGTISAGATSLFSLTLGGSDVPVIESDEPILFYQNSPGDSFVAYPPTLRDLYGVRSNSYRYAAITSGTSVEIYCSSGTANGTTTGMNRGAQQSNSFCANGAGGTGDGVRLTNQTSPIGASQEADGDGTETSRFLPTPEFGTRYIIPQSAEYVSIVCAPRFGEVNIEVQTAAGGFLDSGTCTPTGEYPGALNINPASDYGPGTQVVATDNKPFYMYYDHIETGLDNDDETNTWSAVQAKKFNALYLNSTFGAEEENQDAQYEQLNYRWYVNTNAITPTTPWPLDDGDSADEGDAITGTESLNGGDVVRLRMNLLANNGTGTVDSTAFVLQYAEANSCAAVTDNSWRDLGDIGSTTAAFAGYDNAGVADGDALPSTLLSDSDVEASYEEQNFSATLPNEVGNGEAVEFDWVITAVSGVITPNANYCFRMIRSTEEELVTYTTYPELATAGPPETPITTERFDNEHASSTQPTLEFVASDQGGDELDYQIQVSTDNTFASTLIDSNSDTDLFDFANVLIPSDKTPFNNGQLIRYTPPSALSNGVTYWWRVRAIDPDGSNTFSAWTSPQSFTINTSITVSEWFQTTDEQFETNSLSSAVSSGSDSIEPDIGGSSLIGEYGSVALTNGATTTVNLNNSFTNPVVVGSVRYPRSIASPNQPAARVFNKTGTTFDVLAENFSKDSSGTSTFDYIVMEAGDYLIDDGADGLRVFATSTSVSAIAGNTIPTDPGGTDIVFPTSFSGQPAVMTMVTTINDQDWVVSSVYDGNDISNPPTASQVSVYLNDNLDANGHTAAEDIDIVVFDTGVGTNNLVPFDIFNTGIDGTAGFVDDVPDTFNFTQAFGSAPGVVVVQMSTMNGTQGGYAQVDTDTPPTATDVTVSVEEGGNGADRGHADEDVAIIAFEDSSGDIIRAGTAQVVSTPIDFDDVDVGNAWGEVDFNDAGTITYQIEYNTGSGFQDIPDSDLPGNSAGFTSGPINILNLDTVTYNEIRLVANFGGVNPELFDWRVTWGQRVETPTLGDPFDNEKTVDTTPTFDFTTTDPQGDDLQYEISYSTDPTFLTSSTTINSTTTPANFANLTTPADTGPFNSGDTITYTIPGGSPLSDGETYWWRVRAKDPDASNSFSPWSVADNFTVDTGVSISTWFQTTQAQFAEGVLDGVTASTSDSIELSNDIGEYGTTTVNNNDWTTVNTLLTYDNMVVVASPKYAFNGSTNGRTVQVRNKTADSFEIKAENYTLSLAGTTDIDYIVMEAGDWQIQDGGGGLRIIAGTQESVSVVEGSNPGYTTGSVVDFNPDFGSTPGALVTVSSANGSKWVGAFVDDGTQTGEVGTTEMHVSLGISLDTDTVRVPEDIDYIAFEVGTGDNNGTLFDAFNTGNTITESETESATTFNQTFSSAPQVIVVQNNANNGGDGGFAQVDTDTVVTATDLDITIAEIGASAGNHATEDVSVLAFENGTGIITRESSSGGGLSGTIASEEVLFSDGLGPKFDRALFSSTGSGTTTLQIQYQTGGGLWELIPDVDLPGNSTGFTSSPVDLTGVDVATYPVIRLFATLQCAAASCPSLDDWTVEWSEGVTMTGTLKEYDRLTNVANATVTVSVNGGVANRTGVVTAGIWSISNVTAFAGDTVTVFASTTNDAEEAVGVFVYDGLGDMTGVELFEQHLSFSSDETRTITLSKLAASDNSTTGNDNVFFDVDGSGNLLVCAVGSCSDANLYIGSNNVFIPATSTNEVITTHDFVNYGTTTLSGNTLNVSGSWDNQGDLTTGTAAVVFTATAGSETLFDADGTLDFNDLTFGSGSGSATWQSYNPIDLSDDLVVAFGTFDRSSSTINVAGDVTIQSSGVISGVATTTFDSAGLSIWTDNSATKQNLGTVIVDGTAKTVRLGSSVLADSLTIGANDTLNAGGAFTLSLEGDFTNNNVFTARTGTLAIVGTATDAVITTGGSSLYSFRASTTDGGSVSFNQTSVTMLGDFTIATGTVTLPTTSTLIGGSFSNTGGTFAHNNAEVRFTGSGTRTIQTNGSVFLNNFYDVSFTGSAQWSFLDTNATTSNTFAISNGTVVFPSGQLSIARDFTTTGSGAFDANGGEVLFLARSADNITANGSSFNDVRIRQGTPVRGGDFDSAWLYRDVITINATEVDDDLTDFPVYVDLSDFDSSFFANVNADGGDIRITESDGLTEVPREIVSISTGGETGELYFKATTLSSTTNSTFYVYYGNSGESDYPIDDPLGAENVWDDDFLAVYHMEDEDAVDSTSFDRDATAVGTLTTTTGILGTAVSITDSGGDDYINLNSNLSELNGGSEVTISTWVNVNEDGADDVLFATQSGTPILIWDNISGTTNNDTYTFSVGGTGTGNRVDAAPTGISAGGTWQLVTSAMQAGNRYIYVDGVLRNTRTGAETTIPTNTGGSNIGRWQTAFDFGGLVDEFRISQIERSADWIAAEYSNMSAPTTFYSVTSGGGTSTRIFADASVTATGDVVIESASAQFPSTNFSIGGSFDNDATFSAGTGAVTFNANTTGHSVAPGVSSFYTLAFNGDGGGWTVTEAATATNAITLIDGNDFTVDTGLTLESTGTFSNAMSNASTSWADATLLLSGGGDFTFNDKTNDGDDYNILSITGDGDIAMWNSTAATYDTQDTASIYSQDHAGNSGDLYIFGEYVRSAGTEHWSYATDFDGADLSGGSERQVDVRVANGASVIASSSNLSIIGTSSASTTVDAQSGSFALATEGATLNAEYFTMTGTDPSGFQLLSSTTVTTFDNLLFTIPAVSSAVTVDASTIDTNPAAQYFNTDFVTGGGNVNVTLSGSPNSFWWFREGSGDRYGEDYDTGDLDPGNIRWDDSNYQITVAGTVYADDGASTLGGPTCDGVTDAVTIVVDGGAYTDSVPCAGLDGSYSFSNVSYGGDPTIVVYLDNVAAKGSIVTRTPTGDIIDLDVYANRVMTRHEDVAPMTIARMAVFDETDDPDLRFVAATGTTNTLIVRPETELLIASSTTFIPGGNITLQSGGSGAVYDGSLHIDNNAIFTAATNQSHSIGGSFFQDTGSTFTAASTTFTFTATTTGKAITHDDATLTTFRELAFTGVGGGWNINSDLLIGADMTVATGTVTGTGDITLQAGTFSGDGLVSMGGGEVTVETTTELGGTQGWTFFDLTLGNGSVTGTTTRTNTATTTVGGVLTIAAGHFLDAGSSFWSLTGSGTIFVESGTFLEDTSTVTYGGVASANILSTPYYNLTIAGSAGTPVYSFGALGVLVQNDLVVAGTAPTTANLNTSDPVMTVLGDVRIGANGTLSASDSNTLTLSGSFTNTGTFNANSGLVYFDGTGAHTIAAGGSDFADLTLAGTGLATFTESATSSNDVVFASTSLVTVNPSTQFAVGGTFSNEVGGGATTWTGSTLYLYGGQAYEINASTTTDVYENIIVGASTHPRMWNSIVGSVTTNGGSLYSMDHTDITGDLYIFGDYQNSTFSDYWSYAIDFDGTDLTGGNERQVDVYVEGGGSASWTAGALRAIGTSTATTTIQNQGSGTYALIVGGTTAFNWNEVLVRNIDSDGVQFTGTPIVSGFANLDLLAEIDSASMVSVQGSVINANPAKNFSGSSFNADTGVTGAINVELLGSSLSAWRFTEHSGNRDGEDYDLDTGDPGEIIWDDSAAIITISGTVYQSNESSVSTACDDSTTNIVLAIAGSLAQQASSSCSSADGSYSISDISFSANDTLTLYINGEAEKASTVTIDPITSITDMDLYENHVIVRHANTDPITIEDMAVFDSSNDADIPFTAIDAGTDTLTLPANTKLLIWDTKEFAPGGNITLSGGGAGAAYDGTLEARADAIFTAASSESHSIGGSLIFGTDAVFEAANSTFTFTTDDAGRLIDTNDQAFNTVVFNGAGDWAVTNVTLTTNDDLTITAGSLTLPTATTTVAGSFVNSDTFDANGGRLVFTSGTGGETVTFGGNDANEVVFNGVGSWTISDVNATATDSFVVTTGAVTLPSGTLVVGANFIVLDTITANGGTLALAQNTGTADLTLSNESLGSLDIVGGAEFTMTDVGVNLSGSLTIASGTLNVASTTLAIGGSLDATNGIMNTATGTILFNSSDLGETVNPGANEFYNVVIGGLNGGWIFQTATVTNNFSLSSANQFTLDTNQTLSVGGVFTNAVGGANTTWLSSTLRLLSGTDYSINTKNSGGDVYSTLEIAANTNIRSWDSSATTPKLTAPTSWYSQDHAGTPGDLFIYGDFNIDTTTEFWNNDQNFDGSTLGASARPVTVTFVDAATSSISIGNNGRLEIVGVDAATTTVQSDTGTYGFTFAGGTFEAEYFDISGMDDFGLNLLGTTTVILLDNGAFTLSTSTGAVISLASSALDANASLIIDGTYFYNGGFSGTNVDLEATTTSAWTFRNGGGSLYGEAFDTDGDVSDDCGSIRWDDSDCQLIEQTQYRWRNDDGGLGVPADEWFDTDWDKRQQIRLRNRDASTYTDAAIEITIPYDANMQSDFEDLRFTSDDGTTEIPYWVESFTASTEALVWVSVPTLLSDTVTSIYMYYDNVAVNTTSSSTATFIAADDFEDNNISEYSGQTSDFQTNAAFNFGGSYGLSAVVPGNFSNGGMSRFDQTVSQGEIIRYRQYIDVDDGDSDEICTLFGVQAPVSGFQNYGVCMELFGTERVSLVKNARRNDSFTPVVKLATSSAAFTTAGTGWYEVEIDWQTDDSIDVTVFDPAGSLLASVSATDSTYSSGGYGFTYWTNNGGWDSFLSRPRLNQEPTIYFGVEQTDGGASWAKAQNTTLDTVTIGEPQRLRLAIENGGLDLTGQLLTLEFAGKGAAPTCAAVSGGSYAAVPVVASCGSSAICMATSTTVANGAATVDLLTGTIGDFSAGAFVEDPSNKTAGLSINQGDYTEVEYAVVVTANASDEAYCFRVTDNGSALDSYARVAELTLQFPPTFGPIQFNLGQNIILNPGGTARVYATTTVTDLNGYTDLDAATSTMFTTTATAACTADNNNCYIATTTPQCSFTNCSGNSCELQCYADFAFHADPTDTDGGELWYAFLEVVDKSGASNLATSPGIDLLTMWALEVDDDIDYGALAVFDDTGSTNASTTVANIGNAAIDIEIEGTDLTDGLTSFIPATQQIFSTSTFTYSSCVDCFNLPSTTPQLIEVDLSKPITVSPPVADEIYWGIAIPFGTKSNPHSGVNTFYVTGD